eukprot:1988617-Lingulodinium_polyedra.AAC.1
MSSNSSLDQRSGVWSSAMPCGFACAWGCVWRGVKKATVLWGTWPMLTSSVRVGDQNPLWFGRRGVS